VIKIDFEKNFIEILEKLRKNGNSPTIQNLRKKLKSKDKETEDLYEKR